MHCWIILVQNGPKGTPFSLYTGAGLEATAYRTKREAAPCLYAARQIYGTRRAYLQKFGPYR